MICGVVIFEGEMSFGDCAHVILAKRPRSCSSQHSRHLALSPTLLLLLLRKLIRASDESDNFQGPRDQPLLSLRRWRQWTSVKKTTSALSIPKARRGFPEYCVSGKTLSLQNFTGQTKHNPKRKAILVRIWTNSTLPKVCKFELKMKIRINLLPF